MDPLSFVRSLELPIEATSVALAKGTLPEQIDNKLSASVDDGSLVSFTAALNRQQKEDVLNSTLLAQLAANRKYDRYKDTVGWYKFYANVLESVGWVLQGFEFDAYESHTASFEISTVVLELLTALVGDEEELVALVKDTLQALAKSEKDIMLFGTDSSSSDHGNFQIVPCTVDKSNQVSVAFIGAYFKASQVTDNYLFATEKKQQISLTKTAQILTLNEGVYSQVRAEVIKKLGGNAKKFVDNLPGV